MPSQRAVRERRPVRRSELGDGIRALGVEPGEVLMAHVSLSELGWVVGGAETVVSALLDVLGGDGTLAAVASWDDIPFLLESWPDSWRRAYIEEMPGFDPKLSQANADYGRFPERLRTWPGAMASDHPDQRVIAVGPRSRWLTEAHPLDNSFGPGTPFSRLVEARGQVLMLGAPLTALTLLHHAEATARVPGKRRWTYGLPFATEGGTEWRTLRDIDVVRGPLPYEGVGALASTALRAGVGVRGRVAAADCHLFPAAELVEFGRGWLEARFAGASSRQARASRRRTSQAGTVSPPH
jgi:aminoglycoside 3-N-acetyltransferase